MFAELDRVLFGPRQTSIVSSSENLAVGADVRDAVVADVANPVGWRMAKLHRAPKQAHAPVTS